MQEQKQTFKAKETRSGEPGCCIRSIGPEKFTFGAVDLAGFEITPDSVRPSKKIIQSIIEFPTPKNLTDVRSWFGLVNQVTYTFSMTSLMEPFRSLETQDKIPMGRRVTVNL